MKDLILYTETQQIKQFLLAIFRFSLLSIPLTLMGCWEVNQVDTTTMATDNRQAPMSNQNDALIDTEADSKNKITQPDKPKVSQSLTNKDQSNQEAYTPKFIIPEGGEPLEYNIKAWNQIQVSSMNINELIAHPEEIANLVSVDKNSLDFASQPAIKYRYVKTNAPYFDMVDSDDYLEIDWYYANPHDSKEEKRVSINHAKKAHYMARQLMGDDGGEAVIDMLEGKIIQNETVGGIKIALAKCQFYACMLVLIKPETVTAQAD